MFMRVVNLLTFKWLFSRGRRGRERTGDRPSPKTPKAERQNVNLVNHVNLDVNLPMVRKPNVYGGC